MTAFLEIETCPPFNRTLFFGLEDSFPKGFTGSLPANQFKATVRPPPLSSGQCSLRSSNSTAFNVAPRDSKPQASTVPDTCVLPLGESHQISHYNSCKSNNRNQARIGVGQKKSLRMDTFGASDIKLSSVKSK